MPRSGRPSPGGPWGAVVVLVLVLAGPGCLAPSEAEVQREFAGFVAQNDQCATASECVVVAPGCPLGCQVAVRADRKEAVLAKARDLIKKYESGGHACSYDCAMAGPAVCAQGRCALASQVPGADGGDAGGDAP